MISPEIRSQQIEARYQMRRRIEFPTADGRSMLKQFIIPDAEEVLRLVEPHRQELKAWGAHTGLRANSVAEVQKWIQSPEYPGELRLGMWNEENALVGAFELQIVNRQKGSLSGYIGVAYQGQGYATQGVVAIEKYAFSELGFRKLSADVDKRNGVSQAVMEKLGYKKRFHRHLPGLIEYYKYFS